MGRNLDRARSTRSHPGQPDAFSVPSFSDKSETMRARHAAPLVPVTKDTDLEALALSQNKRFWKLIDQAIERGEKEGFVDLKDL